MSKMLRKVDPQVRALVAWQQARRLSLALRDLLKSHPQSAILHELSKIGQDLNDTIESGELSKNPGTQMATLYQALGMIDALEQKVTKAGAQDPAVQETSRRVSIQRWLDEARNAVRGLQIAMSPRSPESSPSPPRTPPPTP